MCLWLDLFSSILSFFFFDAAAASIVLIYVSINLALYLILGGQV